MNPECGTLRIKLYSARNELQRLESEEARLLAIVRKLNLDSGIDLCEFENTLNECLRFNMQPLRSAPSTPIKKDVGMNTEPECPKPISMKISKSIQVNKPKDEVIKEEGSVKFQTKFLKKSKSFFKQLKLRLYFQF